MTVPSGRLQFFALEASDYLERLGLIVSRPNPPDPDEMVRLTRALRGAALMAGLTPFARAAQAVEQASKQYKDGESPWTAALAERVADAVEELKRLVRQAPDWSSDDTAAAERLALSFAGGAPARSAPPASDDEIKPSVRAFVGREGALIAGTLEHAAQAVEIGQPGDAADAVLHRLQALRGLATLPSLSPLPDFLDAIELTIRTVRDGTAPPTAPTALRHVARAVTILAREIAESGKTSADGTDVVTAARSLVATFGTDDDVVDIGTLFVSGDGSPIVIRGNPPEPRHTDTQIELVSLADRFRQAADQLVAASARSARMLSLYSLSTQLAAIGRESRHQRPELVPLLTAARTGIQNGAAEHAPTPFAAALRSAAEQLTSAAEGRNPVILADQFAELVATFAAINPPAAPVVAPAVSPPPDPHAHRDADADVVPIESLLATTAMPEAPTTAFETSFSSYHRLVEEAATRRPPPPAPVDTVADVVPIDSLLFRGRGALERADVVRRELTVILKANRPFSEVEPLVSELIDLVPLALAE